MAKTQGMTTIAHKIKSPHPSININIVRFLKKTFA
jgi:hypothetical protein